MTKDTIDRAIKKATGAAGGDDYTEVRYEGYGPSGVAVIVEALTDNRNRTASDMRARPSRSIRRRAWARRIPFPSCSPDLGVIRYSAKAASEDAMLEAAIDAGADNVESGPDGHEVTCDDRGAIFAVRDALEASNSGRPDEWKIRLARR